MARDTLTPCLLKRFGGPLAGIPSAPKEALSTSPNQAMQKREKTREPGDKPEAATTYRRNGSGALGSPRSLLDGS